MTKSFPGIFLYEWRPWTHPPKIRPWGAQSRNI